MINKVFFKLIISKDKVLISVNNKTKKTLSLKNKTINTSDIFTMLKYDKNNEYYLDCKKIPENEITGQEQEIKRLYNYLYELLDQIIVAINDENKKINKKETLFR